MWRILLILCALGLATACGPSSSSAGNNTGNQSGDGSVEGDGSVGQDGQPIFWDGTVRNDGIVGCNPQNFTLQQEPPPDVMLVIDRSGSMLELGSTGNTKWQETNDAINQAVGQFEAQIGFGLLMYPTGDQCMTPAPQVGVGLDQLIPISSEMSATTPAGGTPTAAALRNAGQSLNDAGGTSPKFIVLATDGGPNCNYFNTLPCGCTLSDQNYCCTSYPVACVASQFCLDEAEVLQVIGDLRSVDGIDTFVIGLAGTQEYVELLNSMAIAGGQPQQGGATDYYNATSQAELSAALQAIAGSVISCSIPLSEAPQLPDAVKIYIDGVEIPRDTTQTNGWDYSDATLTEITLYGPYCDGLQDGQQHDVTATFACEVN